jgi:ABC-type transporter Mla MlaB component
MKTTKRKRVAAPAAGESVAAKTVTASAAAPVKASSAIVLASHCTLKDAAALKASLCAVLNERGTVTLDVSGVERIDTATVQLLCAFIRDRAARGQQVSWQGGSSALGARTCAQVIVRPGAIRCQHAGDGRHRVDSCAAR